MTNVFEQALSALKDTLKNGVEINVVYIHNDVEYAIPAVRGSINWGSLNRLGDITLGENYRDYIIRTELIDFLPDNGERIVDGNDTFEVFSGDSSSKCYRYSDPYKQLIRIYTRRILK